MVLPAVWTLVEWVRGWIFTGFPWLNVGYSQTDGPLRGVAPVLGVYGVCFAVALSAGLLVLVVMERVDRARVKSAIALVVLWIMGAGSTLVQWTYPAGVPLRVALAQGAIPQAIKWSPDMRDATLDRYMILSREHLDADLIVWPETALPDFYHRQGDFLAEVKNLGRVSKTDFLIGTLYLDTDTKEYYNSVVSVGPDVSAFYHKRHLVPFTEYLPLKSVLGQVVEFMNVPMSDFSSGGRRQSPITVAGYPVAVSICFEDAFGEELLNMLPAAKMLVNVSNDAWFGDSLAPRQHLQMARMRALETGRPMLRATNTGVTAITDHWGRILAKAKLFEPDAIEAQVTPMEGATPYVKVGNLMIVGVMCFAVLFGVAVGRRATHYGI
jgi:apolipoprotein N-acyltransferase